MAETVIDEQKCLHILKQMPVAVMALKGADFNIELVNTFAEEVLSRAEAALLHESFLDVFPDCRTILYPILEEALTGTTHDNVTLSVSCFGDRSRSKDYVRWSFSPWRNSSGWVIGVLAVGSFTERPIQNTPQQQTQAWHLKKMADTLPVVIWMTDREGRCHYLSQAWFVATGQTRDAALGMGWLEVVHPDDREQVASEYLSAVRRGFGFSLSYRLQQKNGSFRWVIDYGSPHLNAAGEQEGYIGTIVDVHEEIQTKEQLRIALEGGEMGFYDYYPQTGQLNWSEKTRTFYGLADGKEPEFACYRQAIHPDDRERALAVAYRAMAPRGLGKYENEYRVIGIDTGEFRWLRSVGRVYFDANGEAYRFSGIVQDITRQKETWQSLLLQSSVLEQMDEGVSISDENGVILFTNAAEDRMFGYPRGELAGQHVTVQNAYGPDENKKIVASVIAELKSHGCWKGEWHNIRKDGRDFYTYSFITNIVIDLHTYFVCVQRDITDEKRAKEALEKSEQRFRYIFEAAPVSIWEQDFARVKSELVRLRDEGVSDIRRYFNDHPKRLAHLIQAVLVTDVNEATLTLTEAEGKEQLLAGLPSMFVEDTRLAFIGELEIIFSGGGRFEYECKLRTLKGRDLDVLVTINFPPLSDAYNRIMVTLVDVSLRKEAERKIRESENHFRILTQSLPQLVWTTDGAGKVDFFNDSWYAFTAATPAGSMRNRWMKFIHPDDRERLREAWVGGRARAGQFRTELRLRNADHSYKWCYVVGCPVRDSGGNVVKWVGTVTNIDAQKEIEENLERTVRERTLELKRSNEDLQQFAHVTSHDLKEPLRKIMTFANRIKDEYEAELTGRMGEYLEKITVSAGRLTSMIEGILTYSVINTAERPTDQIDLNEIVDEVKIDLELLFSQLGATVSSGRLPVVTGSRLLIYQLFYNLINNSLKFRRPEARPVITIETNEEGKHGFHSIRVSDNGIGFDPRYDQLIFNAFERLHSKSQYEGTGLGLALCKKIMERHDGNIEAHGKPGEGATFVLNFPKQ